MEEGLYEEGMRIGPQSTCYKEVAVSSAELNGCLYGWEVTPSVPCLCWIGALLIEFHDRLCFSIIENQ